MEKQVTSDPSVIRKWMQQGKIPFSAVFRLRKATIENDRFIWCYTLVHDNQKFVVKGSSKLDEPLNREEKVTGLIGYLLLMDIGKVVVGTPSITGRPFDSQLESLIRNYQERALKESLSS